MSGPAEVAVLAGILADAGLKATAPLGLGWLTTRLLRRSSAAQRHAVWAAVFATLPLLPAFAAQRGASVALDAPWIVGVWAAGFAVAAAPLLRGLVTLERLRRDATDSGTDAGHGPPLLHTDSVGGPITFGLLRPVVVLPTTARGWSDTHRSAALAHERAHIERRDWAIHLAVWGICAAFWFHPLAWMARRELQREAEHAADDAVLAAGIRPTDYATLLVVLARAKTPGGALAVGSSQVARRVHALLDLRSRSDRRWPAAGGALLIGTLAVSTLGGWAAWSTPADALTCQPEVTP